jgi:glycosyltransferase involved in cell wall biosynthesis
MNYSDIETVDRPHPLRIGYVWQYKSADLSALSATTLHVKAVIQAFEKRGHQVRMISFYQGQPHWSDDLITWHKIEPKVRGRGFRFIESIVRGIQSRLRLPYFNLFDSHHFADACVTAFADCDILYERFWILASGGLIAAKKLGIPIIYEVNGDLVEEFQQIGFKLSRVQWLIVYFITRRMFEGAGHIVTVSQTLKEKTMERWHLRSARVSAIENGAHVDQFAHPDEAGIEAVRTQYRLNGDRAIVFVGTFKPWHGLDLLIDAFQQVAASKPNVKLILVGDGPLRTEIETRVADLHLKDQVIFTGLVQHQHVPALLGAADIAVLNPKLSGASAAQSPLKLFEYMAAGKAIVAPKIANVTRILADRQTGLLVPPNNSRALKQALFELLEDDQLRLSVGQAAQRQAIEQHSWDRTTAELEKIFLRAIGV